MDLGINAYEYEQYNSIWCKVLTYDEMDKNLTTDSEIITNLIDTISMCYTPESWCGHFQLEEDHWKLSLSEHHLIVNEMIEACWFYQNDEILSAQQDRDELLSVCFDIQGGTKNIENESEEKQKKVQDFLKRWYASNGVINEKNELANIVFQSHEELREKFLFQLFAKDVRFYINKTIEEAKKCLYDNARISPAVIGIDDEKVAMLWFNY